MPQEAQTTLTYEERKAALDGRYYRLCDFLDEPEEVSKVADEMEDEAIERARRNIWWRGRHGVQNDTARAFENARLLKDSAFEEYALTTATDRQFREAMAKLEADYAERGMVWSDDDGEWEIATATGS